jgi:tetratricopeptide (TPR) repeat protein
MMLQEWDWAGAEQHFLKALELSPSHAQIRHDYAHFLLATGRQSESLQQTEAALALDPANPMLISCLGWHSLFDRRNEQAMSYATEANALMPDQWAHVILGWALLGQDKPDEALEAFREAARLSASAFNRAALGYALAVTGRTVEARQIAAELLERAEDEYVSAYDVATIYAGLGDHDETFRWLRRAAEERSTFFVHLAWDLRFDRVRDDERFRRLVGGDLGLGVPLTVAVATPRRRISMAAG